MSLVTTLTNLATRIGTEVKALRTLINGNAADLTGLSTTAKGNLVAAINEVKAQAAAAASSGGASISDTTTVTTSVWSSSKTQSAITAATTQVKSDLLNGAPAAYDTLKEIADYIATDQSAGTALTTSLGNLTSNVGDTTTDFVAAFNTAVA